MLAKCAHVFLIKPRRTIKTQPKDVKQCTQTTQKLKRGSPVIKLRNNFEKKLGEKNKENELKNTPNAHHRHSIAGAHIKRQK